MNIKNLVRKLNLQSRLAFLPFVGRTDYLHSEIGQRHTRLSTGNNLGDTISNFKNKLPIKKLGSAIAILALIVLVVVVGGRAFKNSRNNNLASKDTNKDKVQVAAAKATKEINREFKFPLKDSSGESVSEFKYEIINLELRDEIVIQGQKATAVAGREFLIVNLKITNDLDQSIEINTRDFVRLSTTNGEGDWLAPDIHNDPVEVQPISTKYTRLGFPIDIDHKELVLRVGEINGEKQELKVNF